nr:hypothetical protein [Methanomethylovorans hollandica]
MKELQEVFFNNRLSHEIARITSMVQNGEKVIIPFCSVGPFVVHVGAKGADIVAFEKNNAAISMLQKNTSRNKVMQNLSVICADTIDIP